MFLTDFESTNRIKRIMIMIMIIIFCVLATIKTDFESTNSIKRILWVRGRGREKSSFVKFYGNADSLRF